MPRLTLPSPPKLRCGSGGAKVRHAREVPGERELIRSEVLGSDGHDGRIPYSTTRPSFSCGSVDILVCRRSP